MQLSHHQASTKLTSQPAHLAEETRHGGQEDAQEENDQAQYGDGRADDAQPATLGSLSAPETADQQGQAKNRHSQESPGHLEPPADAFRKQVW